MLPSHKQEQSDHNQLNIRVKIKQMDRYQFLTPFLN